MGRNPKQGIDYFPADVDMFQDRKIKRLLRSAGGKGLTIYIYLLTDVYRDKGYYYEWDEHSAFDISDDLNFSESVVEETVKACCSIGLFNEDLFSEKSIISSESIQNRWQRIVKDANRVNTNIDPGIKIVEGEPLFLSKKKDKPPKKPPKSSELCNKVKESKEKKSKEDTYVGPSGSDEFPEICEYLDEARELAGHLLQRITEWKPDHKYAKNPPSLNRWILDIERMIRLDGRDPEKIKGVIDYTFQKQTRQAQFWAKNIWSGEKLRDKYDRLVSDYKDEYRNSQKQQKNGKPDLRAINDDIDEILRGREAANEASGARRG